MYHIIPISHNILHACHMHILISIYIYIHHISYHIRRPRGTETQRQNMYTYHAYIMRVCTHMDMPPDMTHATQRRQDKLLRLHPRNQVKNGLIGNAKVFATGNASPLSCGTRSFLCGGRTRVALECGRALCMYGWLQRC